MSKFNKEQETRLIELLKEEIELFKQIKELAVKETKLLASDDGVGAFNESLSKRENIKEKINGLHQETEKLMQSYISFTTTTPRGKIPQIEKLIESLQEIIAECSNINEKNITIAGNRISEFTKRIKELDTEKKTFDAYTHTIPDSSELFDRKT